MFMKTTKAHREGSSADGQVSSWQLMVLVICMAASIASGVGAYAFLSTTLPIANRLSWSLEPPRHARAVASVAAPGNLLTADAEQRRRVRVM